MDWNHVGMKLTLFLLAIVGIAGLVAVVVVIVSLIVFIGGGFPRLGTRTLAKGKDNRQISKIKVQASKLHGLGKR